MDSATMQKISEEPALETVSHPMVQRLAQLLFKTWETHLNLEPYHLPEDLGYVEGQMEGDRLTISNRCFQTKAFRKIHLELATVGGTLDILHCVMFPRPEYDLPILGTDIVANPQLVSAAIIDLSPVRGALSEDYLDGLSDGYEKRSGFSQIRELPTWGTIFSPRCLFTRVGTPEEADLFLEICTDYLNFHCHQASVAQPAPADLQPEILAGHRNYCQQQQQNDKTRRILVRAFGEAWTERYMNTVLFDLPV